MACSGSGLTLVSNQDFRSGIPKLVQNLSCAMFAGCIDKKSSAELSEAINSMFKWYRKSRVCFVFLLDVHCLDSDQEEFRRSVWFTRAWTLQELLAPKIVVFLDSSFKYIGTRKDLTQIISEITGIGREYMLGIAQLNVASVAERMKWASNSRSYP